jgi:hypothetical protein
MLGSLARSVKDGALALSLKAYVNDKFRDYGEVIDCSVDTGASRLTAQLMMRGERDPVTATIEKYEIEKDGDERFIKLVQFSTSRIWLTTLLNSLFAGKRYKLPGSVSKLL